MAKSLKAKAAQLTQAEALAILKAEAGGGGVLITSLSKLGERSGRAPQTIKDWFDGWKASGVMTIDTLPGNRGTRLSFPEAPAGDGSDAAAGTPNAAEPGRADAIEPETSAAVVSESSEKGPNGEPDAAPRPRPIRRRAADPNAPLRIVETDAPQPRAMLAALRTDATRAIVAKEAERRFPVPARPDARSAAMAPSASDGRIPVHPIVSSLAVNSLGVAMGAYFLWFGYQALAVSLSINMAYAETLGASEAAKASLKSAFMIVGYLAAYGPVAAETLWMLGMGRIAWGAMAASFFAFLFGLNAAFSFVASQVDATTEQRGAFVARVAQAEADMKGAQEALDRSSPLAWGQADAETRRAQETLDRVGMASWSAADQDELTAKLRTLGRGGEGACTAAKVAQAVADVCGRITALRETRSNASAADGARATLASSETRRKAMETDARAKLADAETRRKGVETDAKAAGVTLGSEANPVSLKIAGHVQAASFGFVPLTPHGVDVIGFFIEASAPELAVYFCFWIGGALMTGSCGAMFRRRDA